MIIMHGESRVLDIGVNMLDVQVGEALESLKILLFKGIIRTHRRHRKTPGHQANRKLLPAAPIDALAIRIRCLPIGELLAKSANPLRIAGERISANPRIKMREAVDFPGEFDIAALDRMAQNTRRSLQRPTRTGTRIKMPVDLRRHPV